MHNVGDPTAPQDVATKAYVDSKLSSSSENITISNSRPSVSLENSDGKNYEIVVNGNNFSIDEKGVKSNFIIDSQGNVGIGTVPSVKLDVDGHIKNNYGILSAPFGDWRRISVQGDASKFYPVKIPTYQFRRDVIEIMQGNVHSDGAWYGSLHFIAQFNNCGWGNVPSVNSIIYNARRGNNSYVARFADAAHCMIPVVWLRGDQVYAYRITNNLDLSVVGYENDMYIYNSNNNSHDRKVSPMTSVDNSVYVTKSSGLNSIYNKGSKVGIATSDPSYTLHVNGTFYHSGSSKKYKKNIKPLEIDSSKIYQLKPVSFDYKKEYKDYGKKFASGERQIGLIAEDVAKVIPQLAVLKDGEVSNVDYEKLSVLLLKAVQEQQKQIQQMKKQIKNLQK
jgi:hypothetical protein